MKAIRGQRALGCLALAALCVLFCAGCQAVQDAVEPIIKTQEVDVAVPTTCNIAIAHIDMGKQVYADTAAAIATAPDVGVRGHLVLLGNRQRALRLAQIEPALRICAGLPPLPEEPAP